MRGDLKIYSSVSIVVKHQNNIVNCSERTSFDAVKTLSALFTIR